LPPGEVPSSIVAPIAATAADGGLAEETVSEDEMSDQRDITDTTAEMLAAAASGAASRRRRKTTTGEPGTARPRRSHPKGSRNASPRARTRKSATPQE
jgi:hypothetical protein